MAFPPPNQPPTTLKEVQERIDQLYGDREAKNVGEGLVKGAVSVGKGVFAGVGTLIASPLVGIAKAGIPGLVAGTLAGVVGAVTLPVIGVVQGAQQLGTGIMNTPEAVREMMNKDKVEEEAEKAEVIDDPEADELNEKTYSLSRETVEKVALEGEEPLKEGQEPPPAGDIPAAAASSAPPPPPASSGGATVRVVKETALYEVLGVEVDATSATIKKAYYRLAREYHPDKNAGDEASKVKFQEVAEAYQILMDEDKREQYDRYGSSGLQEGFMDPGAFFTMSFGADKFESLVGTLTVAYTAGQRLTVNEVHEFQVKREKTLAAILIARLEPWMRGYEEKFVEEALAQTDELKKEPFGQQFLHCIGYNYYHRAQVCLGLQQAFGLPGFLQSVRGTGHAMQTRYKAVDAALKLADMQASVQAGVTTPEASMPKFLDAIWLVSVLDIESTLRHVVELVVKDKSVGKEVRSRRATGIMRLGKVFSSA